MDGSHFQGAPNLRGETRSSSPRWTPNPVGETEPGALLCPREQTLPPPGGACRLMEGDQKRPSIKQDPNKQICAELREQGSPQRQPVLSAFLPRPFFPGSRLSLQAFIWPRRGEDQPQPRRC